MLAIFETAVRYHLLHALALVGIGLADARWPNARIGRVGWLVLLGIAIFSGSLYALALSGLRWFGAITPLGGLAFIIAWAWFAIAAWRADRT